MLVQARRIRRGKASSEAVVCRCPISFLGGIDPADGTIADQECASEGESISGKVFCFPFGKGSTVGSYSMYQLRLNGNAPSAIVNNSAEPIIATGAIIAEIPMVDGVDIELLRTGDEVTVDADEGTVEISNVEEKHVVTSIVRSKGRILLLCRSDKVGSYKGLWAGVSGFIEDREGAEDAARRELMEEIAMDRPSFTRSIEPQMFRDGETIWCVHPFLVDAKDPVIKTDWEHRSFEWVSPKDLSAYATVPGLQQVISKLLGL
jgi:predicted aconitase with swiveling domain/8-oxo-dGTP pyrophosphatase MutT (NUDIX family)